MDRTEIERFVWPWAIGLTVIEAILGAPLLWLSGPAVHRWFVVYLLGTCAVAYAMCLALDRHRRRRSEGEQRVQAEDDQDDDDENDDR